MSEGELVHRPRRRAGWLGFAILLSLVFLSPGCSRPDQTPEGAVKLFVEATMTREGDATEVYRLLAPESQRELKEKARLANAQASGRTVRPEDLLAVGREPPRHEITQIRTLSIDGDRARVEISSGRTGVREELQLRRVNGAWRIVLPRPRPAPPAPPASRPAPLPAASQPAASAPASRSVSSPRP